MSGIVGVYDFQRGPIARSCPEDMLRAIAHRGPDGLEVWHTAGLTLGHAALHTTAEAVHEQWPLRNSDGTIVLVADARIDNRADLCSTLRPQLPSERVITDADLILAAYEQWGTECAIHLIGDFAFALWDERQQHLFCVRDVFGVRPFFYVHDEDRQFAFASEIKALLELGDEIGTDLNEEHIADFLVGLTTNTTATVYTNIHRLPPAHTAVVTSTGVHVDRYWAPDPDRVVRLGSDAEYAAAFRAHFDEAVRCRLRSPDGMVGGLLSGGLDSSSIVATARAVAPRSTALHTFSTVFDEHPTCDERRYIESVAVQGRGEAHITPGDSLSPVRLLDTLGASQDQPFGAPNLAMSWLQYTQAQAQGCRVLLDGHGGDEVASHGDGRLFELARDARWGALARELYGLRRTGRLSNPWELFWAYVWGMQVAPWLQSHPRAQAAWNAIQRLKTLAFGAKRPEASPAGDDLQILSSFLWEKTGVEARYRAQRDGRRGRIPEAERHARLLSHPVQAHGFEVLDPLSASMQVETRYPFWDRRLVEFCLALPSDQKLRHGWDRYVLREAMRDRLPEAVRLRAAKADFLPFLFGRMRHEKKRLHALLFSPLEGEKEYVEETEMRDIWCRLNESKASSVQPRDVFSVWSAAVFLHWLRRRNGSVSTTDSRTPGKKTTVPAPDAASHS